MIPRGQWTKQEHDWGCGPACLAMVTGRSYAHVVASFPKKNFAENGLFQIEIDSWLFDHDFAVMRKWRYDHNHEERQEWPPLAWSGCHIACVIVSESSKRNHFVVMLSDGIIWDPLMLPAKCSQRLTNYYKVENVAAILDFNDMRCL